MAYFAFLDKFEAPAEKAQRIAEERARTLLVAGCPPKTSEEDLWQLYPGAECIKLSSREGKFTGTAWVRFGRIPEAEDAARAMTLQVKGKGVRVAIQSVLACCRPKIFFNYSWGEPRIRVFGCHGASGTSRVGAEYSNVVASKVPFNQKFKSFYVR